MAVNLGSSAPEYYRGYENGKQESAARIRELEAQVKGADAANSRLQERVIEVEAENAALKKVIEIDECGRGAIETRDKEIARKDAALEAAGKAIAQYDWFVDSYVYQPESAERTDYINHRVMVINDGRAARALIAKEEKA